MYDHGYFIARCICTSWREAERSARVRLVYRWQQPTPRVSYRTSLDARLRRGISRSCPARSRRHPHPVRIQGGIALRGNQPLPTGRSHDDRDTPSANRERHHGTDRATQRHELATGSRFTDLSAGCVRHAQWLSRAFQPRIFSRACGPRLRQATGWILRLKLHGAPMPAEHALRYENSLRSPPDLKIPTMAIGDAACLSHQGCCRGNDGMPTGTHAAVGIDGGGGGPLLVEVRWPRRARRKRDTALASRRRTRPRKPKGPAAGDRPRCKGGPILQGRGRAGLRIDSPREADAASSRQTGASSDGDLNAHSAAGAVNSARFTPPRPASGP